MTEPSLVGTSLGDTVVFDRRSGQKPIGERTSASTETSPGGRTITMIRG